MNVKTWEPYIGLKIIEIKMCKTRWFLHDHIEGFAFNLKELGWLKRQEVQIIMEDANLNFKWTYKLGDVEKAWKEPRFELGD